AYLDVVAYFLDAGYAARGLDRLRGGILALHESAELHHPVVGFHLHVVGRDARRFHQGGLDAGGRGRIVGVLAGAAVAILPGAGCQDGSERDGDETAENAGSAHGLLLESGDRRIRPPAPKQAPFPALPGGFTTLCKDGAASAGSARRRGRGNSWACGLRYGSSLHPFWRLA